MPHLLRAHRQLGALCTAPTPDTTDVHSASAPLLLVLLCVGIGLMPPLLHDEQPTQTPNAAEHGPGTRHMSSIATRRAATAGRTAAPIPSRLGSLGGTDDSIDPEQRGTSSEVAFTPCPAAPLASMPPRPARRASSTRDERPFRCRYTTALAFPVSYVPPPHSAC